MFLWVHVQVGCWHRTLQRRFGAESAEGHSGGFCGDLLCGESQGQRGEEFGGDTGHGFFWVWLNWIILFFLFKGICLKIEKTISHEFSFTIFCD